MKIYVDPGISVHFAKMAWYIWLKFCMEYKWDLGVDWYQNQKKNITELGHSDRLKIYTNPSKIYVNPGI